MQITRSNSSPARRARLIWRAAPLGTAAALVLTAGCTSGGQPHEARQQPAHSSVSVDHGSDGSVSVDGGWVSVSGGTGSISVQRNPDGSVTVTRPGTPPTTVPPGSGQGPSVSVDPSNRSSGSLSVSAGGGRTSVSVAH
jgi:hypothetical protein